jgi:hypothetical protein
LADLTSDIIIDESKRKVKWCSRCTGCGVQLFPEIVDASIEMLKQHGMIEEKK